MTGFFSLETPTDLREKLRRDLERLKADPMSTDAAFNFFVTALHMLDLIYPGLSKKPKAKRDAAEKAEVLLQVCSNLGNGAKHFKPEANKHTSVSSTSEASDGLFALSFGPERVFAGRILVVNLEGAAAAQFGHTIGAIELAEKVMEYWNDDLQKHLDMASSPVQDD